MAFGIGWQIQETPGGILTEIGERRAPFLLYLIGVIVMIREPVHEKYARKAATAKLNKQVLFVIFLWILLTEIIYFITLIYVSSLADSFGLSAVYAGLLIGVGGMISAISGILYGRFIIRYVSHELTIFLVFLCMAVGMILIVTVSALPLLLIGTALQGFGIGIMRRVPPTWIATITSPVSTGIAMRVVCDRVQSGAVPCTNRGGFGSGGGWVVQRDVFAAGIASAVLGVMYLAGASLLRRSLRE